MKNVARYALIMGAMMLAFVQPLYAEITHPYSIDEKAQVLFGDSTVVSGHDGLENYAHEYVGGYLHITFTYSHSSCCFSSYPPLIYITAEDPRSTSSPTVRDSNTIYTLTSSNPTDWYSYDVQFDSTGYTKVVKKTGTTEIVNSHVAISGQTDSDYAALANNYPKTPTSAYSMSFTPLLVHEATQSSSSSSSSTTSSHSFITDRRRCAPTTAGWYCPDDETRMEFAEMYIGEISILISEEIDLAGKEGLSG